MSWYTAEFETTNPFDRPDAPGDDRPAPVPVIPLDDLRALVATCAGRDFRDRHDAADHPAHDEMTRAATPR